MTYVLFEWKIDKILNKKSEWTFLWIDNAPQEWPAWCCRTFCIKINENRDKVREGRIGKKIRNRNNQVDKEIRLCRKEEAIFLCLPFGFRSLARSNTKTQPSLFLLMVSINCVSKWILLNSRINTHGPWVDFNFVRFQTDDILGCFCALNGHMCQKHPFSICHCHRHRTTFRDWLLNLLPYCFDSHFSRFRTRNGWNGLISLNRERKEEKWDLYRTRCWIEVAIDGHKKIETI